MSQSGHQLAYTCRNENFFEADWQVVRWADTGPSVLITATGGSMHYGRFCRESGRWVKVEADQTLPAVAHGRAAEIVAMPEPAPPPTSPVASLVPIDETRKSKDATDDAARKARKKEAAPP